MIAVIDYGAGNLRSIRRALERAGAEVIVTNRPADIAAADGVVLPGVGAAAHAMDRLHELGLTETIRDVATSGRPFLGICLGMQLLFGHQEEGDAEGLGLIPGRVRSLPASEVKVPHMGWNQSAVINPGPLGDAGEECFYYFVHSYIVEPEDPAAIAAASSYGEHFPSVVVRDNIWGTQFHPEKSGDDGLALIERFVVAVNAGRDDMPVANRVGA
ncbi:MAG TPA: imidazole glycerol phosphate synthase subunit HisH [Thermomicrobiales bacterium]|jgi:glutamine amidotransferase|nr:imidazole glycerol phosphate synthase subunit HisH [Thermomicrobiales bacterium]